jgi:hypothetical protein
MKFVRCVRVLFHYLSCDAKGFVDRERKREQGTSPLLTSD